MLPISNYPISDFNPPSPSLNPGPEVTPEYFTPPSPSLNPAAVVMPEDFTSPSPSLNPAPEVMLPEDFTPQSPSLNPAAVVLAQVTAPDDSPGTRKRKRSRKRGSGSESSGESPLAQSPPREVGDSPTENETDGATGKILRRRKHPKRLLLAQRIRLQRRLAQLCLARRTLNRMKSAYLCCLARRIMERRSRQSAPNVAKVVADTRKRKRNERIGKRSCKGKRNERIRKEVMASKIKIEKIIRAFEKRDRRSKLMEAGEVKYPGLEIPPKNFNMSEYNMCREYMRWRFFEFDFPIPRKYKTLKLHYNQIRKTRGYGVTVSNPFPSRFSGSVSFEPIDIENNPILENQKPKMIKDLVREMQQKLKRKPKGMQLTHVVKVSSCSPYMVYLTSYTFKKQQAFIPTSPGEVEVVANCVEARYRASRRGPFSRPVLCEWKLKNGSKIVYCSRSTKSALEYFNKRFYTYFAPPK